MGRSDLLPPLPPHFVSFVWRYHSVRLRSSLPPGPTPAKGPGAFGFGNPTPIEEWRRQELPGSWGTLLCLCPVLRPRRTCVPGQIPYADTASAQSTTKALTRGNFGAHSHGLDTGCLRFARWVTRTGRKTRFRLLASSTGWDWLPTGFLRKVSKVLLTSHPPFPSFPGADPVPFSAP